MVALLGLERGTIRRDLAIAGGYLAGGLVLFSLGTYRGILPAPERAPALFLLTLLVAAVAVALRRVATRTGLALGAVALAADLALGGSLAILLAFSQVLYDACVYGAPTLWRVLSRVTVATTVVITVVGVLIFWSWQGAQVGVLGVLIGVLPVVTGISVRQYRDQAETERARAEQTARLAELDRRQAVAGERTRMARELHDVIANHLSAVAIHATAALSVTSLDREQVNQALRVIRENSVQGLAEMRQMIGLLREPAAPGRTPFGAAGPAAAAHPVAEPPDLAVGPPEAVAGPPDPVVGADDPAVGAVRVRLAEVDLLVEKTRGTGLAVRMETVGEPRPLPVSVDLAAYRIVQESLTNALKHGAGQATLTIDYRPDLVSVTVENLLPGRPDAPDRAAAGRFTLPGAGAGLIGMRERAALLAGRFDAGPRGSRWRVHAELPTAQAPR